MEGAIVSACRVNYDLNYDSEGVCHLHQVEENVQLLWVKRKLGTDTYLVADLLNNYSDSHGFAAKLVAGESQKILRDDDEECRDTVLNFSQMEIQGILHMGMFSVDVDNYPECPYDYFPSIESAKSFIYQAPQDLNKYPSLMEKLSHERPDGPTHIDYPSEVPGVIRQIFENPDSTDARYKWRVQDSTNPGLWNPDRVGEMPYVTDESQARFRKDSDNDEKVTTDDQDK